MQVVAILPCRGRKEQTLECVRRLLATDRMQHGVEWRLVVVSGTDDSDVVESVAQSTNIHGLVAEKPRLSYWEALQYGTNEFPADYYVCLANDLLPAVQWLTSAMEKMKETFSDGVGVVGFNGDGHQANHACHLVISSKLLDEFGGWPVWYHHNYGDTEICFRAREMGRFVKAPYSILFHNHPWISAQKDDEVYQLGRSKFMDDDMLFVKRRKNKWKF